MLNQLLKHTSVQGRFSCNMVALVGSQPRTLTLKDFLVHFLEFRWGRGFWGRVCVAGWAWLGYVLLGGNVKKNKKQKTNKS